MKIEDREQMLSIVQQLLEDNANNRITLSLVQGIIATARGLVHVDLVDMPTNTVVPPGPYNSMTVEASQ
jgi:hypothetical protein